METRCQTLRSSIRTRSGWLWIHGEVVELDGGTLALDGGAATVFCTVRAPYRRLPSAAVRAIMGHACQRAGLDRVGAHRLRHSLATEMLRAGASLPKVGQVLRHRSQLATSVYAKVDDHALRVLVRRWPGGAV